MKKKEQKEREKKGKKKKRGWANPQSEQEGKSKEPFCLRVPPPGKSRANQRDFLAQGLGNDAPTLDQIGSHGLADYLSLVSELSQYQFG